MSVSDRLRALCGAVARRWRSLMGRVSNKGAGERGASPRTSPGRPPGTEPPRPLKYLWAASVTGALLAELAASSTGPAAEFLRAVLVSAGIPVRVRHVLPPAVMDCRCCAAPTAVDGAAVEGNPGGGAPADESIPRPSPGP
jgi:hypothetical protein